VNSHFKKPELQTRLSYGGIPHGSPEYYAAIERVRQRNGSAPTLQELDDRRYQAMQETSKPTPRRSDLPRIYERTCRQCGGEFETTTASKLVCSPECLVARRANRYRDTYVPRPRVERACICDHCESEFKSMNPKSQFCSKKCRERFHYLKRQNAEVAA